MLRVRSAAPVQHGAGLRSGWEGWTIAPTSTDYLLGLSSGRRPGGQERAAAADRPLAVRRRRDLLATPLELRGVRSWHLKDPVCLRHWQFGDEELFLWQRLDGEITLRAWQDAFQRRFAPRRVELGDLQSFLGMLHREGLIVSGAAGQAGTLRRRAGEQRREQWLRQLANPLAIRLPGVNPDALLTRLVPALRWMLHPLAVAGGLAFMLSAIVLVLVEWPRLVARLPEASAFLTAGNVGWLALALAIVKIIHELAHAVACKHFGGECHELGLMLLVFTPCLYCNVSDTWQMPGKWQRIAVGAAGMYAEMCLAAAAAWCWWFTAPGTVNTLCLNVMVVGSLSTLVFNGNPLLRYDGYFILSDWLEMPNLGGDAQAQLRRAWQRLFCRVPPEDDERPLDPCGRAWLGGYAVASTLYRAAVMVLVLVLVQRWLAEQKLASLGWLMVGFVLCGMAIPWFVRATRWAGVPRRGGVLKLRLGAASLLGVAAGGVLLGMPWPRSVAAPATLRPARAIPLYVATPGRLQGAAAPGTRVRAGDPVATLVDHDLAQEVLRLEGEVAVVRQGVESLRRQHAQDPRSGVAGSVGQRQVLEQSLVDLQQQLAQRRAQADQLVVRAPVDGYLLPPSVRPQDPDGSRLGRWWGTPLDPANVGCTLETGTLLGYVCEGGDRVCEAVVAVDQADLELLTWGCRVRVQLAERPGLVLEGHMTSIASLNSEELPLELVARRLVPVQQGPDGTPRALGNRYLLRATLDGPAGVPWGSAGEARIDAPSATLARRLYEAWCRLFGFAH